MSDFLSSAFAFESDDVDTKDPFETLTLAARAKRDTLISHPIYGMLHDRASVLRFMEYHVYAVMDFMCLLKSLQARLTVLTVPWYPPVNTDAARFINEIVVAEETDIARNGDGYISHYDMYIDAMKEAGADSAPVQLLIEMLRNRQHYRRALVKAEVPTAAQRFVGQTMHVCLVGKNHEVASYFVLGRENLIPDMFRQIVRELDAAGDGEFGGLIYYLDRHIEVDEGEHGPAAERMLRYLCGASAIRWKQAEKAALDALDARHRLWDAAARDIERIRRGRS